MISAKLSAFAILFCSVLAVSGAPLDIKSKSHNDVCKGVVSVDPKYFCGDSRLGPKDLPKLFPLDDITHPYNRLGGLTAAEFLAKWTVNGSYTYPPQNGFQLDVQGKPIQGDMTLLVGTLLDRFGSEYGAYMSPAEAPYPQRALPPSNLNTPADNSYPYNYHVYNVTKEFVVQAGPIAPWFGQPGQGVQYFSTRNIMTLIADGFLEALSKNHSKLFKPQQ
ncbi:hypothetical protein BGZ49_006558 [Haplosporangium sp. Z 27]|nr:hypothetical protein BGZ49_006558 [Haplosporangium sp. Z 27]